MDTLETYFRPIIQTLRNPYIVGVLSILAVVYGSLMAPQLPPIVASWFANPIFKVLFIFLILAVRNISPIVSILLALGLVISMQTLNRYRVFTMANEVSQMTSQPGVLDTQIHPSAAQQLPAEEIQQLNQELIHQAATQPDTDNQFNTDANNQFNTDASNRFNTDANNQFNTNSNQNIEEQIYQPPNIPPNSIPQQIIPPIDSNLLSSQQDPIKLNIDKSQQFNITTDYITADQKPMDSLHPMNRPTAETKMIQHRIEDPNALNHPGLKVFSNKNIDVYELNPPFLRKNFPNQFGNPQANIRLDVNTSIPDEQIQINAIPPRRKASRYSAYHGYPADNQPLFDPNNDFTGSIPQGVNLQKCNLRGASFAILQS